MKKREAWVDNVKVIACILVVLGHFFQSMVKSGIIYDNSLYQWFNRTIYYFHVPLFFICSGYLYQKYSKIDSVRAWMNNVFNKFIALGIPYFIFSTLTWVLKKVFSSSANSQVDGLGDALFMNPLSPYWYLYALFFIFVITITLNNRILTYIYVGIAVFFQILYMFGFHTSIYAIDVVMQKEIWFIIGALIAVGYLNKVCKKVYGIIAGVIFLLLSIDTERIRLDNKAGALFLGFLACFSVISIIKETQLKGVGQNLFDFASRYTMPVFLMHTLFAAPFRSILIKIGIENAAIHIVCGIIVSFAGPIVATEIINRIRFLDFILYPNKYIKIKK